MSSIVITGAGSDMAKAIQKKIAKKYPKKQIYMVPSCLLDVRDITQSELIFGTMKPEVLINCAGYISPQNIAESDPLEWQKELDINLFGAYNVSRAAAKYGCKTFIHIGSTSGSRGRGGWSGYSASKAGLISLVESLSEEGYYAYCISPGRTDTKMRDILFPEEDKNTRLTTNQIAQLVYKVLDKKYKNGSNIVIIKHNGRVKINVNNT